MDQNDLDESFLTVAEVAGMLKLNQQTVRNWIDQGSLPALRVGRRIRIKRSDLQRILSEGYSAGTGAAAPEAGPSAEDFWGGGPVGTAEPARSRNGDPSAHGNPTARGDLSAHGAPPAPSDPSAHSNLPPEPDDDRR